MSHSPLRPWFVGSLAVLALAGCQTPESGQSCRHCTPSRQPPPPADNRTCYVPAAPATSYGEPQEAPAAVQAPALPAVPDLASAAAGGPQLPAQSEVQTVALPPQPLPRSGERCLLVGKLEPGAEHGTWNLCYDPDPATNRAGGVIQLVSSQPLSGFRTGQEVQVEGYVTPYDRQTAFQVEHLTTAPSP